METGSLVTYMTTLAALTLTPGPLVAVLAARSASADRQGACALAVGICAGDILVIVAICIGLGFWLQAHPEVFFAAKYAGVAVLLWMAWRMWCRSVATVDAPAPAGSIAASLLAGLAICLSSPQTVVMYLVLLPRVADLTAIGLRDAALLIVATVLVLAGVFFAVILLARTMQRLLGSATGVTLWSRCMSLAVAVSAVWILVW